MDFIEYKTKLVKRLRESQRLFSNRGKKELELWVVRNYLNTMGVPFSETELYQPKKDPPDVVFHNAQFEIMELYDEGRCRHDEYRRKLKKAEDAKDFSDVLETVNWDLEPLSLPELTAIAELRLKIRKENYSPAAMKRLDVLIYVNLQKIVLDEEDLVLPTIPVESFFRRCRSVSLIFNKPIAYVAHTSADTPDFIRSAFGKIIWK